MIKLPRTKNLLPKIKERIRERVLFKVLPIAFLVEKKFGKIPPVPDVTAKAVCVIHRESGQVVMSKNSWVRFHPASLTKLATSLLLCRNYKELSTEKEISVVKSDLFKGSTCGARVGEMFSLNDVLYAMMLPSGNDAANIASRVIGTDFPDKLHKLCRDLGLKNTLFKTPHGSDTIGQFSTAYDLAKLSVAAFNEPAILEAGGTKTYNLNGRTIQNTVENLGEPGIVAGKTGSTPRARGCLSVVWTDYVIVVLGSDLVFDSEGMVPNSDKRYDDVKRIIDQLILTMR